jgi:hypothetical protein
MSTRSNIGVRNTDGTIDYIYCHFDGYPKGVGEKLINHYQDMDEVNALMKLGDLSSLDKEIGQKHDFNDRVRGWCHAYGRDRGETNISVSTVSFDKFLANDYVDYLYIFDGEFWECYDSYYKNPINLYNKLEVEVNQK